MTLQRRTVAETFEFDGVGLHSGAPVSGKVEPGENGIAFRNLAGRWRAVAENVTDTNRCTRLGEISTIEHLMSALAGMGVTDAEIEVHGGELPAMGGCSSGYVDLIRQAGLADLGERFVKVPFKRVYHHDGPLQIAMAGGSGHWRYAFETGDRWPGSMSYESLDVVRDYVDEVATARTIVFEEQIEQALALGLGRGLDESSTLVIGPSGYSNPARFADEPARHKLLDLVGDLFLSEIPPQFLNVAAVRSGHKSNVAAALLLRQHLELI